MLPLGGWGGGGGGSYTFLYPQFVVLLWLAFLSVSLFLVCFLGVVHMSQPVNINVNRPLGSLHTIVSPVK